MGGDLDFSSGGRLLDPGLDVVSEEDPAIQEKLNWKQLVDVDSEVDGDASGKRDEDFAWL